jgi:hypothetical protein
VIGSFAVKYIEAIYITPGQGFPTLIFAPASFALMQARWDATESLLAAIHARDVDMAHFWLDNVNEVRRQMQQGDLFVSLTDAEIAQGYTEPGPDGQSTGMFSPVTWRPVVFQSMPYKGAPIPDTQQWTVLGNATVYDGSPK